MSVLVLREGAQMRQRILGSREKSDGLLGGREFKAGDVAKRLSSSFFSQKPELLLNAKAGRCIAE